MFLFLFGYHLSWIVSPQNWIALMTCPSWIVEAGDFFMAKRPLEVSKAAATWLPALTIHSSLGKQQTLE